MIQIVRTFSIIALRLRLACSTTCRSLLTLGGIEASTGPCLSRVVIKSLAGGVVVGTHEVEVGEMGEVGRQLTRCDEYGEDLSP